MPFNLIRAIKSTHRHPINRVLHCIGLPLYVIGFALVVGYFTDLHTNPCLFLTGHKIEGNLTTMTLIILFKYFKSKKRILTAGIRR